MQRFHRVALLAVAVIALGVHAASAGFAGTEVYVASVGRAPGAAGSQWYTTVWVYNPNPTSANVQFFFLERDHTNPAPPVFNDTIPGGDTRRYDNAIATMFAVEKFGALRVLSADKLIVNSRIYSVASGEELKDSVGQFFAGVPATFAIGSGQKTQLLGVYQTSPKPESQFRYNFGFVETTGGTATVRVHVLDESGTEVASKDYSLGPYEPRQYAIENAYPGVNAANLRLEVEVLGGTGKIVAFGSGLANRSNDPSTFEMAYRDELLGGSSATISHDATLTGDGSALSPLGVTVPLELTSSTAFSQAIKGTTTGGESAGVKGVCTGGCSGLQGMHTTSNNYGYIGWQQSGVMGAGGSTIGVIGQATSGQGVKGTSSSGFGVYGLSGPTAGITAPVAGVWGDSQTNTGVYGTSASRPGVYGETSASSGVYAYAVGGSNRSNSNFGLLASLTAGVFGTTADGIGVQGVHTATSGTNPGVWGETRSTAASANAIYALVSSTSPGSSSAAVRAENRGTGNSGIGVWASQAGNGYGVFGSAVAGIGVYGVATTGNGVLAVSAGTARDNAALRAYNTNSSGGIAAYVSNNSNYSAAHFRNQGSGEVLYLQNGTGLFIKAVNNAENDAKFTVDAAGNVRADGTFASPAADFAELLPAADGLEPADVLVIAPSGELAASFEPYQGSVVGVYSTRPAFLGGSVDGDPAGHAPLAITGVVPVKVTAENGPIQVGDLLTTSSTPGHAMRCSGVEQCFGRTIGKAMRTHQEGAGTITVLLILQ
jgi:hypothetical protein